MGNFTSYPCIKMINVSLTGIGGFIIAALVLYCQFELMSAVGRLESNVGRLESNVGWLQSNMSHVMTQVDRLVESSFLREDAAEGHGCIAAFATHGDRCNFLRN